jgi:hypothetical protein
MKPALNSRPVYQDIPLVDSTDDLGDSHEAELALQLCAVLLNNLATCLYKLDRTHDGIYAAR